MKELYDFEVILNNGNKLKLSSLRGKKVLLVNTASNCGFTKQYEGLQEIYERFQNTLVIIGFPCNQFGNQEPGGDEEIGGFCQKNFGVTFPLSKKVEVNGEREDPLFHFAKEKLPGLLGSKVIKWNFTKFLFDEDGKEVKRFSPKADPESIVNYLTIN